MSNFYFYQKVGGDEDWKVVPVGDVQHLPTHMYRTILSLDTPPTDSTDKAAYAAMKYSGPLYFDLDDASSPASTAKHLLKLVSLLVAKDVNEDCMEVFASGGKGFHLFIRQEIFIEKPAKGYALLPSIYKEMAYEMAVDSMDFVVYSARRGRMIRVANVLRPNGMYKVQLTMDEVRRIAAMEKDEAEAFYKTLCETPRTLFEVKSAPRAFGLQALFESCKKKVEGASRKAAKMKPVELPDELPSFDAMLRGQGIRPDAGFHPIALQVAVTAHARNMSCQELVDAAEGLINEHQGDGSRYNTPDKRRRELIRMWDYTEDNPCYGYAAGAIRSLLSHQAPDLAGIQTSAQEVQEEIDNPSEEDTSEFDHAGVILTEGGLSSPTEGGVKKILALGFHDTTEMLSASSGKTTVIQTRIKQNNGRDLGVHTLELDMFNSASALNKAVMPFGQVFTGTDQHARGLYLRLTEKARKGGRRVYVVNREGVDVIKMPFHSEEIVRKGVTVFADRKEVLTPQSTDSISDFSLRFVGYPNPLGIYQSDLSQAPTLQQLTPEEREATRNMLWNLLRCQTPAYLGKLIGWTTSCHYRMMFHSEYSQFPLLHIAGAAGAGKTTMMKLVANLHYLEQEPKMLTPTTTSFAIKEAVSASSSIPLIIDEYKPHKMSHLRHDDFKLMFRDAYNCREISRGGGNRESSDFRVLHTSQLAAPICFIAEVSESEPAVMERVVLLTLVKPPASRSEQFFKYLDAARKDRHLLGVLGAFMARSIVNTYDNEALRKDFDPILDETRKDLTMQPGDENLPYEERKAKSSVKERTVYNYAVLRFGLTKFSALVNWLIKNDENKERKEEIQSILNEMYKVSTSSVAELQAQTIPEWMTVFNTLTLMAGADVHTTYYLKEGRHYDIVDAGSDAVLQISARECYTKYRIFCAATNDKPLFPSEQAFIHAISHIPCRVQNMGGGLGTGSSIYAFDLNDMRMQGFEDMPTKGH